MRKTVDKRIVQTEAALQKALLHLLTEKKCTEITVGELTAAAAINRSTFYLHYRDVAEFCEAWETALVAELQERMQAIAAERASLSWEEAFPRFLSLMQEKREIFSGLLSPAAGKGLWEKLAALWEPSVRTFAARNGQKNSAAVVHALGTMLTHGLIAVCAEWLRSEAAPPPEEMAELLGAFSGNESILKKFRELG